MWLQLYTIKDITFLRVADILRSMAISNRLSTMGFLKEIVGAKQINHYLLDGWQQYSTLKSLIKEPLMLIDVRTGCILEVNAPFERLFGWSIKEIIGIPIDELSFWYKATSKYKIIQLIIKKQAIRLTDIQLITKDGDTLTGELSARLLSLNKGLAILATFEYSHQLITAEPFLNGEEKEISMALDPISDIVTVSYLETGVYIRTSESLRTLLNHDANALDNKTEFDICIWTNEAERTNFLAHVKSEGPQLLETALYRAELGYMPIKFMVDIFTIDNKDYVMMVGHDVTTWRRAERRAMHLAYHDPLTNLPNRTLLYERLKQQIKLVQRYGLHAALLFLDLDHFKNINDSIGHPIGDAVLKIVTTRLKASIRANDTVSRVGGDEFIILLTRLEGGFDSVESQVLMTAERVREILCEPMLVDGHRLQISTSIGVTIIPEHGTNTSELVKRADIALYKAKELGRNMIATFRSSMQSAVVQRMRIEAKMRQALQNKEFKLCFHPQVFSRTHEIIGAEVLIRWVQGKEVFSPEHFINILEETQLIIDVGEWVVFEACRLYANLMSNNKITLSDFKFCVNVSPKQLQHEGFYSIIERALTYYKIPQGAITLEVTEGIVIEETNRTVEKMNALKGLGVNFAIDDFGTGYSSLSYLKRLPIDMLKIDKAFVDTITTDIHDAGIVSAIITMANSLDFEVIAEGVETVDQLSILEEKGCYLYQGYLFSKPLTFDSLKTLLISQSSRQTL